MIPQKYIKWNIYSVEICWNFTGLHSIAGQEKNEIQLPNRPVHSSFQLPH